MWTVPEGLYLAPGLHLPLLAGLRVAAHAPWGWDASQELAVKRPQAAVLPVHALSLPDLEAPAAVPGALCAERVPGLQCPGPQEGSQHPTVRAAVTRGLVLVHDALGGITHFIDKTAEAQSVSVTFPKAPGERVENWTSEGTGAGEMEADLVLPSLSLPDTVDEQHGLTICPVGLMS